MLNHQFVGRQKWIEQFDQHLDAEKGLTWRITGVPGIGKSTLLRHLSERCDEVERPHVFFDLDAYPLSGGLEFLKELIKSARFLDAENANKSLKEDAGEGLTQYRDTLGHVVEAGSKMIDPTGVLGSIAKALLKAGDGTADSMANISERQAAENPELFLLNVLAAVAEDGRKPVCFFDTFEHALAGKLKVQSRLDFGFAEPRESTLKTQPLAAWLLSLFEFLRSKGWRVVIAGRNMKEAATKDQLNRFTRDEIAQAASQRPDLGPYIPDQADAIIDVLATLSFEGNPLWLQVAMNLLENLLVQGEDLEALAKQPDYLHQCFEEEDPFDSGEDYGIEGGQCKLQLIGTLTRHIDGLEDQAWKIALPRVLDKGIVGQLFEAGQEKIVIRNFDAAGVFRHSGKQFSLHEEIRDLLLAYARSKGWLESEETREIHGRLWEYLNEFYLGQLPGELRKQVELGIGDIAALEVQLKEHITLLWMLEACYHRVFSLNELTNKSVSLSHFWKMLAGSVSTSCFQKWLIANFLPNLPDSGFIDLLSISSKELKRLHLTFGIDVTDELVAKELSGRAGIIHDVSFWQQRVENHGLAGDYLGLKENLRGQPEHQITVIDEMLGKHQNSKDALIQDQCAIASFDKGWILFNDINDVESAINCYDDLLRRHGSTERITTQEHCASALINKGVVLSEQLSDFEAAIDCYDDLLRRYGSIEQAKIQKSCAEALIKKALIYGERLDDFEAVIESIDHLLLQYGDLDEVAIQDVCALALVYKGLALANLNDLQATITCLEELLTRYVGINRPEIQRHCQNARANLAKLTLINGQSESALNYIKQLLEQIDSSNSDIAIMYFLRWIAASETPQQTILNAIHELPADVEYSWDWNDIRPLINQLPEPRKTQANHYIAFFEEHHNIERLESELASIMPQ